MKVRVMSLAVALAGVAFTGQAQAPAVRIVEPTEETVLIGDVLLRVEVPLVGDPVTRVVFQVDGIEACQVTAAPWECRWDAGSRLAPRVVRAIVTFGGGSRATAAVRTRDPGDRPVFRSRVATILVPAHVTDGRGRFVRGLAASDFRILEDGEPQEVELLGTTEIGAEVLLAIDVSQSMTPVMADLKVVVGQFLDALPGRTQVTLAAFNTGLFFITRPGGDRAAQVAALDRLRPWGATAIYDTMIRAAEQLKTRPGRRALVVFTDGADIASQASIESARVALQSSDILLYLVATGRAAADAALRKQFAALAVETGGGAFFSPRLRSTAEDFAEIVSDLTNQYLLSYSPKRALGDGKWRALTVSVTNRRYTVRARTGYFAVGRDPGRP